MEIAISTWNSGGFGVSGNSTLAKEYDNTWEVLTEHYMMRLFDQGYNNDQNLLMGMLAEAGTPPNPPDGADVANGKLIKSSITDPTKVNINYCWYGWSKDTDNLRCSLAAMQLYPKNADANYPFCNFNTPLSLADVANKNNLNTRPAAVSEFIQGQGHAQYSFQVILVHLPSGAQCRSLNISILKALMNHVNGQQIPSIILGDMNINILNQNKASIEKELGIQAGANWNVVRTGYATQRSGNELDWALCFKCNNAQAVMIGPLSNSNAGKGFGTVAQGVSDHALIDYEFDL